MSHTSEGGIIAQISSPEVAYRQPTSAVTARLTGETIIFPASASNGVLSTKYGTFEAVNSTDGDVSIIERPESFDFILDDHGPFKVCAVRFYGGSRMATVMDGETVWTVPCPMTTSIGDRLTLNATRPLWAVQT